MRKTFTFFYVRTRGTDSKLDKHRVIDEANLGMINFNLERVSFGC